MPLNGASRPPAPGLDRELPIRLAPRLAAVRADDVRRIGQVARLALPCLVLVPFDVLELDREICTACGCGQQHS